MKKFMFILLSTYFIQSYGSPDSKPPINPDVPSRAATEFLAKLTTNLNDQSQAVTTTSLAPLINRTQSAITQLADLTKQLDTWATGLPLLSVHRKRFDISMKCLKTQGERCKKLGIGDTTDALINALLSGATLWHTFVDQWLTKKIVQNTAQLPLALLNPEAELTKKLPAEIDTLNKNITKIAQAAQLIKPFCHMLALSISPEVAPLVTKEAQKAKNQKTVEAIAPYSDPSDPVKITEPKTSDLDNFTKTIGLAAK